MTCFLSHIKRWNSYFLYLSWVMCLFWEKSLPLHFCVLGMRPNQHKELQMTAPSHLLLQGSHVLHCFIGLSCEGSFSAWMDGKCWHLLMFKEIIHFYDLESFPSRGRTEPKNFILYDCITSKAKVNSHTFNGLKNTLYRELCFVSLYFRISSKGLKFPFLHR